MISVIIPVYNVTDYIDRCLSSVVNQTYREIEIILVNDGSNDGTEIKCRLWAESDSRIKLINKKNEGQGTARNLALSMATGEYVAFIDGDDWWDLNLLQRTYDCIRRHDAEVVVFDMNIIHFDVFERAVTSNAVVKNQCTIEEVSSLEEDHSLLYKLSGCLWDKLWKRSLITSAEILMPNHPFEDEYVVSKLLIKAKRICQLREALYYYYQRAGSTMFQKRSIEGLQKAFLKLKSDLADQGILDPYYDVLRGKAIIIYQNLLRYLMGSCSRDEFDACIQEAQDYIERNFPEKDRIPSTKLLLWGSYNLRAIARKIATGYKGFDLHYSGSSILSAAAPKETDYEVEADNAFRRDRMLSDLNKSFLASSASMKKMDFVLIDLLEERLDLLKCRHTYYTATDEIKEYFEQQGKGYELISRMDIELEEWKRAADRFIEVLKTNFQPSGIILVKNKMALYQQLYGKIAGAFHHDEQGKILMDRYAQVILRKRVREYLYFWNEREEKQYFAASHEITRQNHRLDSYYDYFIEQLPGLKVIEVEPVLRFTDTKFMYGAYPYYYNDAYYYAAADQIKEYILSQGIQE